MRSPLPFTDNVLDAVARHEMYNFLDGFNGYNQVRMHPDDQEKTTFVTDWTLCCDSHDVWVKDGPYHIPVNNYGNFWGIYTHLYASLLDDFVCMGQ